MKSKQQIFVTVISVLLILLFTYAAISKLMDYHQFSKQLNVSTLLKPIAGMLTWMIPSGELYIAILLVVPEWRTSGMKLSFILMSMFSAYIAIMLLFFDELPCSCGGVFERMSWNQHLLFNLTFTFLAFAGLRLQKQTHTKSDILSR